MGNHRGILFLFIVLLGVVLACTLPAAVPTPPVDIGVTQTSLALTQTAMQNRPADTPPIFTATATLTPTITPTLSPSVPIVTVSIDTNCRSGPGTVYEYLAALFVGEQAEVVGKYTATSPVYWIIKKGSFTCWLWGQYATVEGETSNLPEIMPPPTPSPMPTQTFTPTSSPTATPIKKGDLVLMEFFQLANHNIAIRVGTNPVGSLSGEYAYTVFSYGSKVKEWTCTIPLGSELCDTGYPVSGTEIIEVVIDTNNLIAETNEKNNFMVLTCAFSTWTCK